MKRVTALTLVTAAALLYGVTAANAEAGEAGGGPRQRWDCIAFAADGDIYVVNLDGTGLTRVSADGHTPAFSPDGTKIAYVCFDKDTDRRAVYVMNVDGTDKRRLSPPYDASDAKRRWRDGAPDELDALYAAGGDVGPVFSPDGETIAATRVFAVMGPWDFEIIFFPTSGGPEENFYTRIEDAWKRKRHTPATADLPSMVIGDLTFSGDGRRVAFRSYPGSSGKQLWVANADGSGVRLLARGPVYSYALSPDGKKVAFWELPGEGWRFCVINADGTEERLLAKGDLGSFDCFSLAFSPDGKKIIYESGVPRGFLPVPDIYIINADGSEPRALTRTPVDEYFPRFTPDGSKIVFYSSPHFNDDSAEPGIYVMNADGSGRRFLVAGDDFSLGPSLIEGRLLDSYGNWHDVVVDLEATSPGE